MILALIIAVLALLSIALAYASIANDSKKHKHVREVEKKLAKGKVLFYAPHHHSSK